MSPGPGVVWGGKEYPSIHFIHTLHNFASQSCHPSSVFFLGWKTLNTDFSVFGGKWLCFFKLIMSLMSVAFSRVWITSSGYAWPTLKNVHDKWKLLNCLSPYHFFHGWCLFTKCYFISLPLGTGIDRLGSRHHWDFTTETVSHRRVHTVKYIEFCFSDKKAAWWAGGGFFVSFR